MMVTLTIVLAEITAVLLTVIAIIGIRALRRYRRDQAAVNTLVINIMENQSERVAKLATLLKNSNNLSADAAQNRASELTKKQNKFYQDAIDLYFTRNSEILAKLDTRLENLLENYRTLLNESTENKVDTAVVDKLSQDIAALTSEIGELHTENTNLNTQLQAAEKELDQLGREYISAFKKSKVEKPKTEASEGNTGPDDGQTPAEAIEDIPVTADADPATAVPAADESQQAAAEPDQAEGTQTTSAEPSAGEAASAPADEPPPSPEQAVKKPPEKKSEAVLAGDQAEHQGLSAELGLHEVTGAQPGRQSTGKP